MIKGLCSWMVRPLPTTRLDEWMGVSQGGMTLAIVLTGVVLQLLMLGLVLFDRPLLRTIFEWLKLL
jgi:hypothetical protein